MVTYLYGAAVQGIQKFIFQSNRLKEIIGGSELVEDICTTVFANLLYNTSLTYAEAKARLQADENAIIFAAGNIKYLFRSQEECARVVRHFPKVVANFAPGITVSQAVVKVENDTVFSSEGNQLEGKLKAQRNFPMRSQTLGLMGILRSRQSGLPVTYAEKGDYWDMAKVAKIKKTTPSVKDGNSTQHLCEKAFGIEVSSQGIAFDVEDLTKGNDWIAIIHADGNGLGQVVQKVSKTPSDFKKFSQNLDVATTAAANDAFLRIMEKKGQAADEVIPIRPVVLGGDDLTVICRADIALEYTQYFIEAFEKQTRKHLGEILKKNSVFTGDKNDCLTACAGIAYVKSSFPFYYAYELAEALCSVAKKDAKGDLKQNELPKSCLMFHKVQDSFVQDWPTIAERELMPQKDLSFEFGPYYITEKKCENRWLVTELITHTELLKGDAGNAVKSHIRNWMSILHDYNEDFATQKLERLKSVHTDMVQLINSITVWRRRGDKKVCPAYDVLAIHTIYNQRTK